MKMKGSTDQVVDVEAQPLVDAVEKVNQRLTELGGQFYDETIQQSNGYAIFKIDARYKYY